MSEKSPIDTTVKSSAPALVAFETMGCRSNYADTMEIQANLLEHGYSACDFQTGYEKQAPYFVLNTCTVTDNADRSVIRALKKIRSEAPEAKVLVTGCMAEVSGERLEKEGLGDLVLGPSGKHKLVSAILSNDFSSSSDEETNGSGLSSEERKSYPGGRRVSKTSAQFHSIEIDSPISPAMPGPGEVWSTGAAKTQSPGQELRSRSRYNLRVQEGCENSCTFCIIPKTRGLFSSRSEARILEDLEVLEQKGYQEVVLSGTHLGGYGLDVGQTFQGLLERIAKRAPALRIRLSSIDPNDLTEPVISVLKESPVFCEHAHVCLQALDAKVLKRMNRLHSLEESITVVEALAGGSRPFSVGADLIVGFPGETRAQFDSALELLEGLPVSYVHVFPYSERSGTAAVRLDGAVDVSERKRRAARLRALAGRKKVDFLSTLLGKKIELVLETKVERPEETGQVSYRLRQAWKGTSREFANAVVFSGDDSSRLSAGARLRASVTGIDKERAELICEQ